MCDCSLLSAIDKRVRYHEERAENFKRMLLVYDEVQVLSDDEESEESDAETCTTESSEPMTAEEHVWAVVTTDGGTSDDVVKNSALYLAVVENGYCQSKTKFTRDTRFLRKHPKIGVVHHGNRPVYRGLKWL
jgi:tellurite resistance-related uncharacterized protein